MAGPLPVAVDAMGGDSAPGLVVAGAQIAAFEFGVPVVLVGQSEKLADSGLPIIEASEVVAMDADAAGSVRRLRDSSIVRAAEAVRDGQATSLLSAGNTGAAMAASLLRLGRIRGVARPAIAVPFPVLGRHPTTLLDCGANAECQPEWLVQFAQLGAIYARTRFGIEKPRVGVLTIGEEAGKGNALVKATCELLETGDWAASCDANYLGNVEGRDLMVDVADVIVSDGFTGNVVLKSLEGGVGMALEAIRNVLKSDEVVAGAAEVVNPVLEPLFNALNPDRTGAAMLLGVRGVSMISHGSSSSAALAAAIRTTHEMASSSIVENIRAVIS